MKTNFESAQEYIAWKRTHGQESLCGSGSWKKQATDAREFIQEKIIEHKYETILDLGCGDWNWMEDIDFQGANYLGIDADAEMIYDNSVKYSFNGISFRYGDIFSIDIPEVDLVICRDVLFHVRSELAVSLINKLKQRTRLHFISTSFNQEKMNQEPRAYNKIEDWGFYRINLLVDPFNLKDNLIETREEKTSNGRSINLFYL